MEAITQKEILKMAIELTAGLSANPENSNLGEDEFSLAYQVAHSYGAVIEALEIMDIPMGPK